MALTDTDNTIIYQAKLHWILFLGPLVLAGIAIFVGIQINQLQPITKLFLAFSVIWGLMSWVTYHFSSLTIKKRQVILRTGMLVRQTIDIPIARIETIDIRQSVIGSIFHYGSLMITGTGGTRHMINFLDKPLTCRRYIEQLMHD